MLPAIIKVSYTNSDLKIELVLTHKFNLIKDISGDGKSKTVKDIFNSIFKNAKNIKVKSDYIIDSLDINKLREDDVFKNKSKLFIIDEDSNYLLCSNEFLNKYKNAECLFLVISREFLNTGYLNLNAVSTIKRENNLIYNQVYFSYTDLKLPEFMSDTIVVVEDSVGAKQFYEYYLNTECVSAHGRNGISEVLSMYKDKKILLIADASQLGGNIKEIINVIEFNNICVKFFLPQSFEYLLLKSKFMKNVSLISETSLFEDINKWEVDNHRECLETVSETLIYNIIFGKNTKYRKNKLPFCLLNNCCPSYYDEAFCLLNRASMERDKFNAIINPNIDYMSCVNNSNNSIIERYFKLNLENYVNHI